VKEALKRAAPGVGWPFAIELVRPEEGRNEADLGSSFAGRRSLAALKAVGSC
jgi:hypothetical protein